MWRSARKVRTSVIQERDCELSQSERTLHPAPQTARRMIKRRQVFEDWRLIPSQKPSGFWLLSDLFDWGGPSGRWRLLCDVLGLFASRKRPGALSAGVAFGP
eukprot:4400362-Amphidinium_carterae.1